MSNSAVHRSIFLTGPHSGSGPRAAIKDCIDVAGETTAAGSRALASTPVAERDAEVIARLRTGGFTIAGRVTMHELAYGVTGINNWTGTPINPHYPHLVPGGSSSGSAAAVAAGLVDIAIGTDTGGSIRVPAACCGVVGFKPTYGRISRKGVLPLESSLDCVGPFARSVDEIEKAMAALAFDWSEHAVPAIVHIGLFDNGIHERDIREALSAASTDMRISSVNIDGLDAAQSAGLTIIGRESAQAYATLLQTGLVGDDVHSRLIAASRITDKELHEAETVRSIFTAKVDQLLETYDVLALPTLPCAPPTLTEATNPAAAIPITGYCRPFNLSGHPAIALPIGEVGGVPVSLQLVGRRGHDETLCAMARTIPLFIKGGTS